MDGLRGVLGLSLVAERLFNAWFDIMEMEGKVIHGATLEERLKYALSCSIPLSTVSSYIATHETWSGQFDMAALENMF